MGLLPLECRHDFGFAWRRFTSNRYCSLRPIEPHGVTYPGPPRRRPIVHARTFRHVMVAELQDLVSDVSRQVVALILAPEI